jgi:hypothetical protein
VAAINQFHPFLLRPFFGVNLFLYVHSRCALAIVISIGRALAAQNLRIGTGWGGRGVSQAFGAKHGLETLAQLVGSSTGVISGVNASQPLTVEDFPAYVT